MDERQCSETGSTLNRAMTEEAVNEIGRQTSQSVRRRKITPHRLFISIIASLSSFSVDALRRAQAAFEGGGDALEPLYRGQLLRDLPEGLLSWLVQHDRVTAEQAGVQAQSPSTSESIPLELDWD